MTVHVSRDRVRWWTDGDELGQLRKQWSVWYAVPFEFYPAAAHMLEEQRAEGRMMKMLRGKTCARNDHEQKTGHIASLYT